MGKGIAILGVWAGWAYAVKALIMPILDVVDRGSGVLTVIGLFMFFFLSVSMLILVYNATSVILDRWDEDGD